MAVSQIIGASIADGAIAAIDITDGTITTAKLAATTGSGNVVLSAAPTLTGNTSLVNLTVSGTQTNSTLTSGRVRYSTTGGLLTDSSNLQFDGNNLGVGITPSAWDTLTAFQIKNGSVYGYSTSDVSIGVNNYYGTSNFRYITSSVAAGKYTISGNEHAWYTAPSGTAGNAITFTQSMTLDASGYLGIGTTSPSSYGGLAVRKAATVSSVPVSASFSDSSNSTFDIRHSANIVNLSAQGSGITIDTGNSTRMTITDAGLVGIGTTSPADALNIGNGKKFRATHSANVYQQIFSSASGNFLNAYGDNFELNADSGAIYLTVTAAQPMVFQTTNTERMRISAAGLVGIGTISPATALDVASANSGITLTNTGVSNKQWRMGISSSAYFQITETGIADRLTITTAGNVGIGTASPSVPLHILNSGEELLRLATSGVNPYLSFYTGTSTRKAYIQVTSSGLVLDSEAASTGQLFLTQGVERMRITSAGKLCINTTSVNNAGYLNIDFNGQNDQGIVLDDTYASLGGAYMIFRNSTGNNAGIISHTETTGIGLYSGTSLIFGTAETERMRITAAGLVGIGTTTPNAKLSINTTTFTSVADTAQVAIENTEAWSQGLAFYIWGSGTYNSGYASGYIGAPNMSGRLFMSGGARVIDNPDGGGNWAKSLNSTAASFINVGESGIHFNSNSGLTVNTAYTPTLRMKIGTDGNVGIGTTSPNQKLTLGSSDGTQALSFVTTAYLGDNALIGNIEFSTNSASGGYDNLANIKAYKTGTNTNDGDLTFWTKQGASSEKMRINASGNVGIGTTSPTAKLDVRGNGFFINASNPTSFYSVDSALTTGSGYCQWNTTSNEFRVESYTNHPLVFGTNNVERMRITSAGLVGIGTSSPTNTLDVIGSVKAGSSTVYTEWFADANGSYFENTGTSAATRSIRLQSSNGSGSYAQIYVQGGSNYISFVTSTTERMRLDSSGNLGIGTTSPNYQLHVTTSMAVGASGFNQQLSFTNDTIQSLILGTGYTSLKLNSLGGSLLVGTTNTQAPFVNGSTQAVFGAIFSKDNSSTAFDSAITQLAIDNINTTTNNYSQLAFTTSDGTNRVVTAGIYAQITARSSANWTTSNLQFYTGTVGGPPTEKMRITSDGRLRFISPSILNDQQNARIQWVNENSNGVMAQISCVREATSGAPGALVFYTSPNVDTNTYSPIERMRITSDGSVAITQTPGKYTIDVTGGATSIANGGTVDFPSASGMLVVNNWTDGGVTIYLCGGGSTKAVADVAVTQTGTLAYNAGVAGYRWTNNYGSTATFGFFFVRTRNTA